MKSLAKILLVSFGLLAVAACQMTTQEPTDTTSTLQNIEVEIVSVRGETDGNTLQVRDTNGITYQAVISPANLGPNTGFDFDHLQPGNRMIISGEAWSLGGVPQITIRNAEAI